MRNLRATQTRKTRAERRGPDEVDGVAEALLQLSVQRERRRLRLRLRQLIAA